MSTIKLYKNNKTLRLPILKFISSNKIPDINISIIKDTKKDNNYNNEDISMISVINKTKSISNISTLQNLRLNSENSKFNNIKETGVQTDQTSFNKNNNDKKGISNILKYAQIITKIKRDTQGNNNINNYEKMNKVHDKNKKKLLENYSQINHYVKNIKKEKKESVFSKLNRNLKIQRKLRNVNKNLYNNNNFQLNLNNSNNFNNNELEDSGRTYIKKDIENLFHNDLILNNLRNNRIRLNLQNNNSKDNNKDNLNISLKKSKKKLNSRQISLPNIFWNLNKKRLYKEERDKLIKSNGRFILDTIKLTKPKFKITNNRMRFSYVYN